MKTLWRFVWSSSKQVWCAVLGQVSCSLFYPDLIILSGGAGPADTRHLYCAAVATVILCYYHVTTLQWYTVTSPLPCHHLPQAGSGDPWYLGQGAGKKLNQLRWYNSSIDAEAFWLNCIKSSKDRQAFNFKTIEKWDFHINRHTFWYCFFSCY